MKFLLTLFPLALTSSRVLAEDYEEVNYAEQIYPFSVKFAGCTSNKEIDFNEENGMASHTWVKYNMCSDCSDTEAGGCEDGGEYLVDVATYVAAFLEHQEQTQKYYCEYLEAQYEIDMEAYNQYGGEAVAAVEYPSYCDQYENEYEDEDEKEAQEQIEMYIEGGCQEIGEDENGNQYFIGYCCSEAGDAVNMCVFSDEECSEANKVDSSMFYTILGTTWPFSGENLVSDYCTSCSELAAEYQNNQNEEDQEDEDKVAEVCESIYEEAWKCEKDGFNSGDETMCAFIESISVKQTDGSGVSMSGGSGMMTFLTTVFSLSTIGLAGYVYFLRDKVGKATINLGN